MRQRFTAAPGVSLRAVGLQTGMTRGVEIDNASGSWLYIPTLETWVPPYTLGWSQSFPYAVASCDIIAGDGPSGQVGTTQGDAITVYLTDSVVPSSIGSTAPGAAFVEGFTPILTVGSLIQVLYSVGASFGVLSIVAGKRYRIRTCDVQFAPVNGNPPLNYDSGIQYQFSPFPIPTPLIAGRVNLAHPSDSHEYPNGLDLPIGAPLQLDASTDFATNFLFFTITYELV